MYKSRRFSHYFLITSTIVVLLTNTACRKTDDTPYSTATVWGKFISCSSTNGYPWAIIVNGDGNKTDTLVTVTLPENCKIFNAKIKFRMRDTKHGDVFPACIASILLPKQVVVYDVACY